LDYYQNIEARHGGTYYNLSTWEVEAGGYYVQCQPELYEFKTSLRYIVRPCLKKKINNNNNKKSNI
jgi:hypothetical protein